MNQLSTDLRAARALVDTPEKWCKEAGARDAFSNAVSVFSPLAVQLSMVGAYMRATKKDTTREYDVIRALADSGVNDLMYKWNDAPERTHADVLAAFDRAIEKAEALNVPEVKP